MRLYLGNLKPKGRPVMTLALNQFAALITEGAVTDAAELDWSRVEYQHTALARAVWQQKYKPAGANVRLAGVKSCIRTAWQLGQMSAEQYMRAVDLKRVAGKSLPRGRMIKEPEFDALLAVCAADPNRTLGLRDAAIFAVFRSGMRVGELVSMAYPDDWVPSGGDEPDSLRIMHGKGSKERWGYLDVSFGAHVRRWIEDARGTARGPLICGVRGVRLLQGLTESAVLQICHRRARQAGLRPLTPHDWRRTTASILRRNKTPMPDIQAFLGHEDIKTTRAYFRDDEEELKRAAARSIARPTEDR